MTNTDEFIATSTNNDLWISSLDGKVKRKITTNRGNDNQPVYSPDGKFIAYRQMARPGFEADRQTLMLYDREKELSLILLKISTALLRKFYGYQILRR